MEDFGRFFFYSGKCNRLRVVGKDTEIDRMRKKKQLGGQFVTIEIFKTWENLCLRSDHRDKLENKDLVCFQQQFAKKFSFFLPNLHLKIIKKDFRAININ